MPDETGGGQGRNATGMDMTLMTTLVANMSLQTAVAGIPVFDGHNIPLKDFILDVRNAASDVPDLQMDSFIKKVLQKLRGSARNSAYGLTFATVDALVKHLKQRFAPGKTFTYYCSQLTDLRMKQGDTVGDFGDCLNILLIGAENSLKEEKGEAYDENIMEPTKMAAIDIFIRGLPANISVAVDAAHPKTLDNAYEEALRIESRINARILPGGRYPSDYQRRNQEDEEMSPNFRPRQPYRNLQGYPRPTTAGPYQGYQTAPVESPAFMGYMDAGEYMEPGDETFIPTDFHLDNFEASGGYFPPYGDVPAFVGYVGAGPASREPSTYPAAAGFQRPLMRGGMGEYKPNSYGYNRGRGYGYRGGRGYGQQYNNPSYRGYGPSASQHQEYVPEGPPQRTQAGLPDPSQTTHNPILNAVPQASSTPINTQGQSPLNPQGARSNLPSASLKNPRMILQRNSVSGRTAVPNSPAADPSVSNNKQIFLTKITESTPGLRPVAQLEEMGEAEMTPQL